MFLSILMDMPLLSWWSGFARITNDCSMEEGDEEMTGKLISLGIGDATEFHIANALHPDIDTDGELYTGTVYGEQRLLMVKERSMDNSDGSAWFRPYQTQTAVYYLGENLEWSHYEDLE